MGLINVLYSLKARVSTTHTMKKVSNGSTRIGSQTRRVADDEPNATVYSIGCCSDLNGVVGSCHHRITATRYTGLAYSAPAAMSYISLEAALSPLNRAG